MTRGVGIARGKARGRGRRAMTTFALMALLAASAPASSTDLAVPPPGEQFHEVYDDEAPVSGSPLVGLALGVVEAPLDLAAITLVAPPPGWPICVRATTRDGRYMASNPYTIEGPPQGGPVRLERLTRAFATQLAGYSLSGFALRAYVEGAPDCSPTGALHLPQIRAADADAPLVVMANGQSRMATARLLDEAGTRIAEAACVTPGGAALIAFDLVCTLSRAALPGGGRAEVELVFNDGFSDDLMRFRVLLPPVDR